jgi:two-component system, OmpR family, response regulator RegX3
MPNPPSARARSISAAVNPPAQRPTILLVEDERAITEPLAEALERDGFEPTVAGTAAEALEQATGSLPDLVLLDIGLPDGSGLDVCRELRRQTEVPIIMLTARGAEADRVAGLELGADDYIVKPFSAREVMARVRAVLRRTTPGSGTAGTEQMKIGDLRLDPDRHEAKLSGEQLELSRKEFELLRVLMESAGSVITREALIEEVWDMNWFGSTKTLDVHISGLRRKLDDDPKEPRFIHTVRGVGFRFSGPDEV